MKRIVCFFLIICFGIAPHAVADPRRTPVVEVVEKVGGAVVNIATVTVKQTQSVPFVFNDPVFQEFFGNFFRDPRRTYRARSLGSGVIIDCRKGHILTNTHVVDGATEISVFTSNNRSYTATLIGLDRRSDIAVLGITATPSEPLQCIQPFDSDQILIGEPVVAIGNPFGFSNTVTTGIVSATGRSIQDNDRMFNNLIQTDTMINPGNSGGPLLNINGDLIGINTAIYRNAQGIGFAIPSNKALRVYRSLVRHGRVERAWVGIEVQELSEQMRTVFGGHTLPYGVLISRVIDQQLAAQRLLLPQDIIIQVGNIPVSSEADFLEQVGDYTPDDTITLTIVRRGELLRIPVAARSLPIEYGLKVLEEWLGLHVEPYQQRAMQIKEVLRRSWGDKTGLVKGDFIMSINGQEVGTLPQLVEALLAARAQGGGKMEIRRGHGSAIVQF